MHAADEQPENMMPSLTPSSDEGTKSRLNKKLKAEDKVIISSIL